MPLHGLTFVPNKDLLTPVELEKVVRAAVKVGFTKVQLIGGEPTLLQDVVEIVRRLASIEGINQVQKYLVQWRHATGFGQFV
ncbi:MAG: hypothetical protein JXM69_18745 [Anaerolineae bacterium]|nr:hypothetical protein [Anaerolineae bacterium]